MADLQTTPHGFRWVLVPPSMAEGVLALGGLPVEHGHPAGEIGDLLQVLHDILAYRVPRSTSRVTPGLITLATLRPLLTLIQRLDSELELRMLRILADAGMALEFETGCELPVWYPDRLSGDQRGIARPDFYHRRARLALFCDSELHHASREARGRDNGVCSALILQGISPLRFTGDRILNQPRVVAAEVLAHLGELKERRAGHDDADAA